MRYPLILNTNKEIQDQDGMKVCGMFEDKEFGEKVVGILNSTQWMRDVSRGTAVEAVSNGKHKLTKLERSERMKAIWAKRKGSVAA